MAEQLKPIDLSSPKKGVGEAKTESKSEAAAPSGSVGTPKNAVQWEVELTGSMCPKTIVTPEFDSQVNAEEAFKKHWNIRNVVNPDRKFICRRLG